MHLILTNWKRPDNIPAIVKAFRPSVSKITVIDNAPPETALYARADYLRDEGLIDDYWTAIKNGGPPIRFAPALHDLESKYTLFWDDDLLPPEGVVEAFIDSANAFEFGYPDTLLTFGELGIIGRNFDSNGDYIRRNVRRQDESPCPVDLCCRAHFMRTVFVSQVYAVRDTLLMNGASKGALSRHDDLLITAACKLKRYGSYLIPAGPKHRDLPAPHALPTTFDGGLDAFVKERSDLYRLITGGSHEQVEQE